MAAVPKHIKSDEEPDDGLPSGEDVSSKSDNESEEPCCGVDLANWLTVD